MHSLDESPDSHTSRNAPDGTPVGEGHIAAVGVDSPPMVSKLIKVRLGRKCTIDGPGGFHVEMIGTIYKGRFYLAVDVPAGSSIHHAQRQPPEDTPCPSAQS